MLNRDRKGLILTLCFALAGPVFPGTARADAYSARNDGIMDGRPDGRREGMDRGRVEGAQAARQAGYNEGFRNCERQERQAHYDQGYREGNRIGESDGRNDGIRNGDLEGRERGRIEGRQDGIHRADRDAFEEATPRGRERGRSEADSSDAAERGDADGLIAGRQQAEEKAIAEDYPRGKRDVRNERYAEPVENEDEFANTIPGRGLDTDFAPRGEGTIRASAASPLMAVASPDYRYSNPRRHYPTPEENSAYRQGYRAGYADGFHSSYRSSYDNAYRSAYRRHYDRGCADARSRNYRLDYDRGFRRGREEGYSRAYRQAYDSAFRWSYNEAFRTASDQAYRAEYPAAYERHFEAARAAAYQERYQELYQAAYEDARQRAFDRHYPDFARREYARGRRDETEAFRARPLRFLDASFEETIVNGVYEPGELLRGIVRLRNFGGALSGRSVRVRLETLDSDKAVIREAETSLRRGLSHKSVTRITKILSAMLTDSAADNTAGFRVSVLIDGTLNDTREFSVDSDYWLNLEFAEDPQFSEGMPKPVKIRVTNRGTAATGGDAAIEFRSNPEVLEVVRSMQTVGALAPGESRVVEFTAIARRPGTAVPMPMSFDVTGSTGRRWGLMEVVKESPVVNDYEVRLTVPARSLRKAGTFRAEYRIRNANSRRTHRSLQLFARITSDSDGAFEMIGPNPQYLAPVRHGDTAEFVVPILVKEDNGGGTLELEVREDGSTVVVHRIEF